MNLTPNQILNKGILAHKKGNFKKAKHLYNIILKQSPFHSDANHNLGILETSLNNHLIAKKFFETALNSNPQVKQFWKSYISNLIQLEQKQKAKLIIEKSKSFGFDQSEISNFYQQLNSEISESHGIAELVQLYKNDQYKKVEELGISILNKDPNNVSCLKILATMYHKLNILDSALSIYNKLITLETNNIDIYNNIGLILQSEKITKKLKKYSEKLIQ